jgi:hypothetical protein
MVSGACPESKTGLEYLIDKKRQFSDLQVELDRKKQKKSIPHKSGRTSRTMTSLNSILPSNRPFANFSFSILY